MQGQIEDQVLKSEGSVLSKDGGVTVAHRRNLTQNDEQKFEKSNSVLNEDQPSQNNSEVPNGQGCARGLESASS